MLNKFCLVTGAEEGSSEEMWCKYESLVFKYAPLETKKFLKRLTKQYLSVENSYVITFLYRENYCLRY